MSFVVEENIARPVAEVWRGLTEPALMARWMGVENIRCADGAVRAGATLLFRARGAEQRSQVCAFEAPRTLTLESKQGGVTARYSYELEAPTAHTTRVRLRAQCRTEGVLWNLLAPLIAFAMRRADSGQLRALRRALEGDRAPSS